MYTLIFVLLAICGLGLGYSIGFVFKWQIPTSSVKATAYPNQQKEAKNLIQSKEDVVFVKQAHEKTKVPKSNTLSNSEKLVAHEKSLMNKIIFNYLSTRY